MIFGFGAHPTDDFYFRKGVAFGLDYELIAQTLNGEHGEVVYVNAASPAQLGFVSGYPKNTRDIQKANAFLDEGGYLDIDGDGFRKMPDGSPMDEATNSNLLFIFHRQQFFHCFFNNVYSCIQVSFYLVISTSITPERTP